LWYSRVVVEVVVGIVVIIIIIIIIIIIAVGINYLFSINEKEFSTIAIIVFSKSIK